MEKGWSHIALIVDSADESYRYLVSQDVKFGLQTDFTSREFREFLLQIGRDNKGGEL